MNRARKPAVEQQVADAAGGLIAAWAELDTLRNGIEFQRGLINSLESGLIAAMANNGKLRDELADVRFAGGLLGIATGCVVWWLW